MTNRSLFLSACLGLTLSTAAFAQTGVPSADRIIRFTGSLPSGAGAAAPLHFAVYDTETGGTLLWEETQAATLDGAGNYSVFLGGTSSDGLPLGLFATGEPRWLSVERDGKATGPRVLLAAVPYAVAAATAGNAASLGGRPATDYLLTPAARAGDSSTGTGTKGPDGIDPTINNGTAGFIGKFFNSVDLDNSALFQSGNSVGLGTTAPLDIFHSRFTNSNGTLTGLAVQNLGSSASSYSGMLFYDHTNTLRQFQGYNNSTGEYRINNISPSASINFMIGSTSAFKIANSGYIGLGAGALTPATRLHIFDSGGGTSDYSIRGTRFTGTLAAPAATSSGSSLIRLEAAGHTGSGFTTDKALVRLYSTETWTTTANGTAIEFETTSNGSATPAVRALLDGLGNLRLFNGDFQPSGLTSDGVRWVNGSGVIQAHMHRFGSVDDRLYVTNAGSSNLTGVYLAVGATSWTSTSDERLKRNITPVSGLLGKIKGIRVASYDMASMSAGTKAAAVDFANMHHEIGSIAQDWLKDFPELVVRPKTDAEYYGLNYERIGVVALGAVKELNAVVEEKDAEIKSLTERITALEAALKSLTTTAVQQQR